MPPTDDLPLEADVAELNREAQKAVDREIAARAELQAAIDNRIAVRAKIADGSAAAVAFIDNYVDPAQPNPAPVAPDVAVTPPAVEPPVFTSVDTPEVAPENSSGGSAEVTEELTVVPPADAGAAAADGAAGSQGS